MRIRKRKVPLPLSLLSPIPLSDPHLFSRSPVMVVKGGATSTTTSACDDTSIVTSINSINSQPSDHLTLTCPYSSASDLRRPVVVGHSSDTGVGEGDEGVVPTSNDDASNASITAPTRGGAAPAVDDNNNGSLLSLSNNAGRWCNGDKAIPLKKRRGSFNNFVEDNNTTATTTTPMIMKVDVKNGVNDDDGDGEKPTITTNNGNANEVVVASAKKGSTKRGNTIMEGSRCSRVNGRGWRCCQPTLVGYSLCEHHLGKGRLRSMTSGSTVKARPAANKKKSNSSNATSSPLGRDERDGDRVDDDDDEKKLEMRSNSFVNNKRVKLGVVKARSLSSLLGQTNAMSLAGDFVTMEHHEKDIDQL